jgi:murein L,D-transpeptidase YafK
MIASLDAMSTVPYYYDSYPFYSFISLVDKSKFEMKTYEYSGEGFKEVFYKKIATGKNVGNKVRAGDEKTPEGIYFTQKFSNEKELKKVYGSSADIYGTGAWTLDYPNRVDRKLYNKTGTGIWIHGTNDPKRIDEQFSSRGCVVLKNEDFNEFYTKINTAHPVVINETNIPLEKNEVENMKNFLLRWKTDWELKNDGYFGHYHSNFTKDKKLLNFVESKKRTFSSRNDLLVSFDNVNILKHKDYYQVNFIQNYKDSQINDIGFKTLYVVKEQNQFKILDEQWTDLKVFDKTANK